MKAKNSETDWKRIAGMRDKLIHAYFGVNLPLVWQAIKKDMPPLKKQAKKLIAPL